MFNLIKVRLVSFLLLVVSIAPLQAATYGFDDLTDNGDYNDIVGQYLSVDVSDAGSNNVLFTFINAAENNTGGVIADIYFSDDPVYFSGISNIDNHDDVNFTEGANPSNLPSGGAYSWGLSADADLPAPTNGIGAGESLGVTLSLGGYTFEHILTALDEGGDFFIGLHVQSFLDGSSESLVSIPGEGGEGGSGVVPIPAAIWLFGSALLGFTAFGSKKKAA